MLISQVPDALDLVNRLREIDRAVASAADVRILVNGKPIADDLLQQLHAVGDPVVVQYFSTQRALIVAKLSSLGVTET